MKKTIYLSLIILLSSALSAQINIDSLENALTTQKMSTVGQINYYYYMYSIYSMYDIEKAFEYAKKGLLLAEKENERGMSSKFSEALGKIYTKASSYDTAFVYWEKALNFAVEAEDKDQEANVNMGIGALYGSQGKFVLALEYFKKALSAYESMGEKQSSILAMMNIAGMYRVMEEEERSVYYLEKAKSLAEAIDYEQGKMHVYSELAANFHKRASVGNLAENGEQALKYGLKAYEISEKLNDKTYQVSILQSLSIIYSNCFEDYETALKYGNEGLQIAKKLGNPKMIVAALGATSTSFRGLKLYKECEAAALEGWAIDSTDINIGSNLLINIILSNIALCNADRADTFFAKYMSLVGRHINQSSREIMADMEVKYETEKKKIRIATLEEEQQLYIGLGTAIVVALLFAIGLLYYRHRSVMQKRKIAEQQIKQLEQEKELVAARSALEAENTEREIIARDLHDGVGVLLSIVKNNMDLMKSHSIIENEKVNYFNEALDVLGQSIVELRRVVYHIKPVILIAKGLAVALDDFCRSSPKTEFHFAGTDQRFDSEKELVLYRCVCELVNNALRHAEASLIDVHLNMDERTVYLSVVDDGCGFDPQTASMGMGINNTRTRLSVFGGNIDIYSDLGKGTEVNIELELKDVTHRV